MAHDTERFRHVDIPSGTTMYVPDELKEGSKWEGDVMKEEAKWEGGVYGVEKMLYRMVGPIPRENGKGTEEAEGTSIKYMPVDLWVHVARRDLAGGEINRIGDLAMQLAQNDEMTTFLPKAVKSTEETFNRLSILAGMYRGAATQQESNNDITKLLEQSGIVLETLKEAEAKQKEKFNHIVCELADMGAVLWYQNISSPMPILLAAQKARRNDTK